MKPALLILAAGMGSRYGGLKQVDPVGPSGEAIIDYSVFDALRAGFGKIVFVIRESFADDFIPLFNAKLKGKAEVSFVFQELDKLPECVAVPEGRLKPWGTGHAVLVAKDAITQPFAVINADDYYGKDAYLSIYQFLQNVDNKSKHQQYCMVGYELKSTLSDHGAVSRGVCKTSPDGFITDIVERTNIEKKEGTIGYFSGSEYVSLTGNEIVSMNIWGFLPSLFGFLEEQFASFILQNLDNPRAEFYIPSVVNELIRNNAITLKALKTNDRWFGVTYKDDRKEAVARIKSMIEMGIYPEKLWE